MYSLLLGAVLVMVAGQAGPELPTGSPAEQVAAIRARLEVDRAEYVRKLQKATTTAERDALMKEAPPPEPYAELMLRVAEQHPNDPAALDALLWVVGNGADDSQNAKARAKLVKDYAESDKLVPFAVALSYSPRAADEDALRQLLDRSKADQVRAAVTYALARQLVAQADMIELNQVLLELAPTDEAKRQKQASLDKELGRDTAERLRSRKSKALTGEAERLLGELVSNTQFAAVEWPTDGRTTRLGELAKRDLEAIRTLRPGNPAPATEGADLVGGAGRNVSLADHRGKVVLLVFTGQWCTACRGMYPLERELSTKHAAAPFTVFGVNSDQKRELATKTAEAEKMTWPVIWDGGSTHGPLATRWNVRGWPLVVLIDHQGIIRYKFNGAPPPAILTPLVDRLVSEADTAGRRIGGAAAE